MIFSITKHASGLLSRHLQTNTNTEDETSAQTQTHTHRSWSRGAKKEAVGMTTAIGINTRFTMHRPRLSEFHTKFPLHVSGTCSGNTFWEFSTHTTSRTLCTFSIVFRLLEHWSLNLQWFLVYEVSFRFLCTLKTS